jgi:predicted RNA binding protein with dsRBD fold (UPF0201 family)
MTNIEKIMLTEEEKKFCKAMEKVIPKLKAKIEEKKTIFVPVEDLAKDMDPKFNVKEITSFYFNTKMCLRANGIHAEPRTKNHKRVLLMRIRKPDDVW